MTNQKKLNLFINKQCNLNCRYCYWPEHPKEEMSEEVSDRIIAYIKAHPDKYDFITFFGGEPMLSPHILAKFMTSLGESYKYIVMTNGTVHPSRLLDKLPNKKWNLCFTYSYDGMYQMDRSEEAAKKIQLHTDYLKKTNRAAYTIGCIVSPYHYKMIPENMIRTMLAHDHAIFFSICDLANSWKEEDLREHIKDIPKMVDIATYYEVCEEKMVHMPNHIEIQDLKESNTTATKGFFCQQALARTDVCGIDGKKYLCEPSYANNEMCYGNLWDDNESYAVEWNKDPAHHNCKYHFCLYKQSQNLEYEQALEAMRSKYAERKKKLQKLKEEKYKYLLKQDECGRLLRLAENHYRN